MDSAATSRASQLLDASQPHGSTICGVSEFLPISEFWSRIVLLGLGYGLGDFGGGEFVSQFNPGLFFEAKT